MSASDKYLEKFLDEHLTKLSDALMSIPDAAEGIPGLRPHQREALDNIALFMDAPLGEPFLLPDQVPEGMLGTKQGNFVEVVSATGTGKTRLFGTIAKAFFEAGGERSLILTPRILLNKQTLEEFEQELGIPAEEIGIYDSSQSPAEQAEALKKPILLSTYQSLPSLMKNGGISATLGHENYRPAVILDEVHKATGEQTVACLNELRDNTMMFGFTATDGGAAHRIFKGQSPVYTKNIAEAITEGLLCDGVKTGALTVKMADDWMEELKADQGKEDFSQKLVEKFAGTKAALQAAIQYHLKAVDEHLGPLHPYKTVFYTPGVAAAKHGAEMFNETAKKLGLNVKAATVWGKMPDKERVAVLEAYKKGEIQALFNDSVLEMGFDAPDTTIVYSLQPTRSIDKLTQQLGRATRRTNQEKIALAINVIPEGVEKVMTYADALGGTPMLVRKDREYTPRKHREPRTPQADQDWPENVTVLTSFEEMATLIRENREQRAQYELPKKPEGALERENAARTLRIDPASLQLKKLWQELEIKTPRNGKPHTVTLKDGLKIACLWAKAGARTTLYLHPDSVDTSLAAIKQHLGIVSPPPPSALGKEAAILALRTASDNPNFLSLWKTLEEQTERDGKPHTFTLAGGEITCIWAKGSTQTALYLDPNELENSLATIARHLGIVTLPPPEGASGRLETTRTLRIIRDNPSFIALWQRLEKNTPRDGQSHAVTLDDGLEVTCIWARNVASTALYLHPSVLEASLATIARHLGIVTLPPPEGASGKLETARTLRISSNGNPLFKALWQRLEENTPRDGQSHAVTLDDGLEVTCIWAKNINTALYLDPNELENSLAAIARHLGKTVGEQQEESHTGKIKPKPRPAPKNIKPGSSDLERGGMARGKEES